MIVGQIMTLNLVIAAGMLIYTSYLDMKKREVEDKVWLIFGGIGGVLQGYEIWTGQASLITLGNSSRVGNDNWYGAILFRILRRCGRESAHSYCASCSKFYSAAWGFTLLRL